MTKPKIATTQPIPVELKAETEYWFCTCGRSATQPFCDGSHQGSEFSPLPFRVAKDDKYVLCRCKRSANQPYCDGSHKRITEEELDAQQGLRTVWYKPTSRASGLSGITTPAYPPMMETPLIKRKVAVRSPVPRSGRYMP